MKKILALCLLLMLTISLTACSAINNIIFPTPTPIPTATPTPIPTATPTPAPLSKNYSTADELVADIKAIGSTQKVLNLLSKQNAVHHFFSKNEASNGIWKLLKNKGYSYSDIYCMYAVCNGSSRWFDALNINGVPLAVYGMDTSYASGVIVSKDDVINQIRNNFKDPYSVSIPGDMILFPVTLSNSQSVMFPTPLEYALWVGARAANSYGGNVMSTCWIKVKNGQVVYIDIFSGGASEPQKCSLRGYEHTKIRITK